MAKVKSGGSVRQHKQSKRKSKRLGVKKYAGEEVKVGQILVRQRGATYKPAAGTALGKDYTLFAMKTGKVIYGKKHSKTTVGVV
ncbi:bL27 family ribosomal protein [Microgenomates group bacterium]|nr:bL27 family ribosomal protein [Microgenomates group bacterium]